MKLCSQYCVMLLGRYLNTCHCYLCLFELFYYLHNFHLCVLAEDRGLYIMHLNRMPTGQVVLHTGNFLGFFKVVVY